MTEPRELEQNKPRPKDEAAERYLDLWDRNQSEIARTGPPPETKRSG